MSINLNQDYFTANEVAKIVNISPNIICGMIHDGSLINRSLNKTAAIPRQCLIDKGFIRLSDLNESNQLFPIEPKWLDVKETAEQLGVTAIKVYDLAKTGKLKHTRLNSAYRFHIDDVLEYKKAQEVKPQEPVQSIIPFKIISRNNNKLTIEIDVTTLQSLISIRN